MECGFFMDVVCQHKIRKINISYNLDRNTLTFPMKPHLPHIEGVRFKHSCTFDFVHWKLKIGIVYDVESESYHEISPTRMCGMVYILKTYPSEVHITRRFDDDPIIHPDCSVGENSEEYVWCRRGMSAGCLGINLQSSLNIFYIFNNESIFAK